MSRITTITSVGKELAVRAADGVEVALLWHTREGLLSVLVNDSRTQDSFELVLGDGDDPLDVFHHPYAYAALRGVDYELPARTALAAAA
jgi:hypothetical protein